MYGEDKTSLEELKNTVNELQSLKIEILPKADKISDLNNSIEQMENQIKQVDENLLNNTQFATTGNETATENTAEEQQQEIKTSENSNLNILISNIDTLTEKVNQAVKVETERKAEEERKAKEEEERKAREEEEKKQKQSYVGTYKNSLGQTEKITMNENGELYYKSYKININNRNKDLGIIVYDKKLENGIDRCMIWPIGFLGYGLGDGSGYTNKNKIRLILHGGGGTMGQENVYYKVD